MHEIEASLAQIRSAWLAGRSALDQAPASWRDAVGGADELALIALAGHATDVLTRQAPGAALVERPLLPPLSAPLIPEALRPRFRRLLATPKNLPSLKRHLIAFVAARDHAAHPGDWMPDAKDDWAPDLYAPWLDWERAEMRSATSESEITAENCEQWTWTERRAALWNLRAADPAAARAIIAAKAATEPADRRLRLIELLDNGLSESDADYLESLAKDRSDRVQAMARAFLARLGRDGDAAGFATELAEMVDLAKAGLINRRTQLSLRGLKTSAQAARLRELFKLTTLASLARALNASELALVESAPFAHADDVFAFALFVAETGSDAAISALAQALLTESSAPVAAIGWLAARLSPGDRRAMLPAIMRRDADTFDTTLTFADGMLGEVPFSVFTASRHYAALEGQLEALALGDDTARAPTLRNLEILLPRVGLLLDAAGARTLIEHITAWGLSPAEPRLDMLHFNAALTPETAP